MITYTFIDEGSSITNIYKGTWKAKEIKYKMADFSMKIELKEIKLYNPRDESKGKKVLFKAINEKWFDIIAKMTDGNDIIKLTKWEGFLTLSLKYQFINKNKIYTWKCRYRQGPWKLKDEFGYLIASFDTIKNTLTIFPHLSSDLLYLILLSYKSIFIHNGGFKGGRYVQGVIINTSGSSACASC